MTQVQALDASPDRSGGYKVDVSRGQRIGRVSSEWFSRPADERYLSLDLMLPGADRLVAPTYWSFGHDQCALVLPMTS